MMYQVLNWRINSLTAGMVLCLFSSALSAVEPESDANISRVYWVEVTLFSFHPDEGIESYQTYGRGSGTPNSTLGHVVINDHRNFLVSTKPKLKSHRLWATVEIKPSEEDRLTESQEREFDLSDLRPRSLNMARDEDGRIYRLNLVPSVRIKDSTPKPFRIDNLQLKNFTFSQSPVIINDQEYVGQVRCSDGPVVWVDIPGFAKVEFSLLHLTDAEPWGVLHDGNIDITHQDGTTLRISGVTNGVHRKTLEGGPYRVWVRWNDPTQSVEEHRKSLIEFVATLRQRIKDGDTALSQDGLQRWEKISESDRPKFISCGIRGVSSKEIVRSDD